MNFTYDLTNIFGSLVNFGTDKEFGNNEDSGNNPLKLKKKEFIRKDGDKFMIIKYDHDIISNDMRDTTGLFRSLIFKNGKLVVFSPPKSVTQEMFNEKIIEMKEKEAKVHITAEEFVEGTMINLFFDQLTTQEEGEEVQQGEGEWEISTRSTVGAKMSFFRDGEESKTFRSMFLDAMIENGLEFDHLNKDYCYSFILQHPDNRIVTPITKPQLYVAAVYQILQTENEIKVKQILDQPDFIEKTDKFFLLGSLKILTATSSRLIVSIVLMF